MSRLLLTTTLVALTTTGFTAASGLPDDDVPKPQTRPLVDTITVPDEQTEARLRRQLAREHDRYLTARRRVRQLTRTLAQDPSTSEAISIACTIYGNCATLWRIARCESGLSPRAKNPSSDASGLFQFMPGTFHGTPFGRLSIWSPYANALAAGWMIQRGRASAWVCR